MATQQEVKQFLQEFKVKMDIYGVVFRDDRTAKKNTNALLSLDILPNTRREIIKNLIVDDYYQGPLDDTLYGISTMWVFGKIFKGKEIYIKVSMGFDSTSVICISFHEAEHNITYPFKN